ncbi:MAG TPA: hypothetical protein VIG47_09515, partial [Gemmatimonadaceae bacterium]
SLTPAIRATYKTRPFANGGVLTEPVWGIGASGQGYTFAENGREWVLNENQMAAHGASGSGGEDGINVGQVHVHVAGNVLTEDSLTMAVYNGLQRMKRRNVKLNLS